MTRLSKLLVGLGLIVLVLGILWLNSCQSARTARTEAKLNKGQADAAVRSGRDAVDTVGNRAAADTLGDALTRENDDAIRNAEGADAPVADGVRDAGLAGLCRRAAYRGDPRCVQHAYPR
ncbi:hypothetical protein DMC47_27635 [Nostoc sp. 3335mG]|nr:hypothetical protein DMC47_27635 [Nostoc sp. 3335mG]